MDGNWRWPFPATLFCAELFVAVVVGAPVASAADGPVPILGSTNWGADFEAAMLEDSTAETVVSETDFETETKPTVIAQPAAPGSSPYARAQSLSSGQSAAGKPAAKKKDPCADSHKGVFYDNDFKYLLDPNYHGHCLGDSLKLMPVGANGEWGTLDVGGQVRLRYHREKGMDQNPGVLRFQRSSNDFLLTRTRLYTDWHADEDLRLYVEGVYAGLSAPSDYIPRPIDENYGDLLNAFIDARLSDAFVLRVGRQELLYGNQRLVSPLDWANTRRTFEGVKLLYRQDDWSVDTFYTNYVPVNPTEFDEPDYNQDFYGFYSVYSGYKNATVDFYYLGYDNSNAGPPIQNDFSLHTLGMRLNGSVDDWLYEFEGGPQFGRQSGLGVDQSAAFATAGIGRKLKGLEWDPTVWFYYDYASGNVPGGDFNRFNQLFPLVHRYLGFIDATQRSNIESPNVLLTMSPTKKTSLLFWYYHMMANQADDIIPSVGGTPTQSLASENWGDEFDFIVTYKFSTRSQILCGWSHFWPGSKIVVPDEVAADFFYTEWTVNF